MAPLPRADPAAATTQPLTTTAPPAAAHDQGDATPWWLSTVRMTLCVDVDARGIIVAAPPTPARAPERSAGARVARKFVGQPSANLGAWLRRQPGFRCEKL